MVALTASIFAAAAARAERPYLPVVGTPPLRFHLIDTNHLYLSMKSFPPEPKSTAASDIATNLTADATNLPDGQLQNSLGSSTNRNQSPINTQGVPAGKNNPETEGLMPDYLSSEGDLPTVTPQMISEYLKPERTQPAQQYKTGIVEFVPVEMQFAPPAAQSPGESRATYNSQ